jgi:hypothetical protein
VCGLAESQRDVLTFGSLEVGMEREGWVVERRSGEKAVSGVKGGCKGIWNPDGGGSSGRCLGRSAVTAGVEDLVLSGERDSERNRCKTLLRVYVPRSGRRGHQFPDCLDCLLGVGLGR